MIVQLIYAAIVYNRILKTNVEESLIIRSTYGDIYKISFMANNHKVKLARKHFTFPNDQNLLARELYLNEIKITQELDHPNIVKAWPTYFDDGNTDIEYLMELGDTDALELVNNLHQTSLDFKSSVKVMIVQMLSAVDYMHSMNVAHLDIKPENILVFNSQQQFKLIDFGAAVESEFHACSAGTIKYMAPEVSCIGGGQAMYNAFQADIYSLGLTFWTLFMYSRETRDCYDPVLDDAQYDQSSITDFLNKMMHCDPDQRSSIAELKQHPWMINVVRTLF